MVVDELAIIDNVTSTLYLLVYADPDEPEPCGRARQRLRDLRRRLSMPAVAPERRRPGTAAEARVRRSRRPDGPIERPFAQADYRTVAGARNTSSRAT